MVKYEGRELTQSLIYKINAKMNSYPSEYLFEKGSIFCTLQAAEEVFADEYPDLYINDQCAGKIRRINYRGLQHGKS